MIEQAAPRSYLNDDAFMGAWEQMGPNIRSEVVRADREIRRGIAIQKDRMMGRGKYDMSGFYGLELAEENAYRIEQTPRKSDDLNEARKRVAELQTALSGDAEVVERIVATEAALEPYRQHAAAQGLTLAEYIRRAHAIEQAFHRGMAAAGAGDGAGFTDGIMDGLCQTGDWIGFDPIKFLMDALHAPREAQVNA
jgi:anion-transporting  ArsA/GET3 family ATPase